MSIQLNYSKYKRFFAFGCSFTYNLWPTWADLLSKEMPHAEYYNFGHMGAGNLLISLRLTEINTKFKFCDTDLVAVMWSHHSREDRWIKGNWLASGNVFLRNSPQYPPGWVKRCADPIGYVIRDLGLMTLCNGLLKSSSCDFVEFFSQSPIDFLNLYSKSDDHLILNRIFDVYHDVVERIKYPLLTHMTDENNNVKVWTNHNGKIKDRHPSPMAAYNYLMKLDFPLTELSKTYAIDSENAMYMASDIKDMYKLFPEIHLNNV